MLARADQNTRPHDHVVHFYDRGSELIDGVGAYMAEAVAADGTALVIATPGHRDQLDAWMSTQGVHIAPDRFIALDAADTLGLIMHGDHPDLARFHAVIGGYLSDAKAPVYAFGEMVSLLWEAGNVLGAIQLETLWNDLGATQPFHLYCAYRAASYANSEDLIAAGRVCAAHSHVVAPAGYGRPELPEPVPLAQAQMFLPVAEAVVGARRFVMGVLGRNYPESLVSDALLVTSELATNAVRHAQGPFRAVIVPDEHQVRVEFHDASPSALLPRSARVDEADGRGLAIVALVAQSWGVDHRPDRKVVWAHIA